MSTRRKLFFVDEQGVFGGAGVSFAAQGSTIGKCVAGELRKVYCVEPVLFYRQRRTRKDESQRINNTA